MKMKTLHGEAVISTSDVSARLGLYVSVRFLKKVGVTPMVETGIGTYWRDSDFQLICRAVARHVEMIADRTER